MKELRLEYWIVRLRIKEDNKNTEDKASKLTAKLILWNPVNKEREGFYGWKTTKQTKNKKKFKEN